MKVCLACQTHFDGEGWRCAQCGYLPERHLGYVTFAPGLADVNDGFSADYFAKLAPREAQNFWFRSRNRLVIWALRRHFFGASSFMEIGCGTGFVLSAIRRELPQLKLSGSEIFDEGLVFAAQRLPGIEFFQMDARSIPFFGEFDVIGAFDVLEHIEEDECVLQEMFQAVKPGGGIILTVPQHPNLWSTADVYSFHKRRYTRKDLMEKLQRAGFRISRITSFVSLLMPLMMLSRLNSPRCVDEFDPLREIEIGPLLNVALEKILSIERGLIKFGFSFPFGGSLLAIASRD